MKNIEFSILGMGAWGANFRNIDDLSALLRGEHVEDDGAKGPKPEVIPANERRRAPLPVRLAIESSWQACQNAEQDPAALGCVFVSGLGDTQLTDYMCRVLAGDNKALSPTKFHNSVHNAAAGYWTISTGCMQAANSIAGYEESVPLTLMEALIQADAEQRPVLMTFYDAPVSAVLKSILKNEYAFSISLIITPSSLSPAGTKRFRAGVTQHSVSWPPRSWGETLDECYSTNPVARVLPLAEMFCEASAEPLSLPLSDGCSLHINPLDSAG